ncbi:putative DNA binding domain-containing protein [Vibrio mediterranei]|uniref:RNA-binding domain-containing protein n=1 Tax=Vibrio mediterranei TaxID=689 RepID=UPI001EFDC256|nr:RNA-binding domain-containing protein [Vibrio mediterranei]MCG9624210.1 putative DNA binding domain-containing protein [Vibrio mediterranei]
MGHLEDWQEIIADLKESSDIECKRAKSAAPKDMWSTYSAFANTYGGTIFLGITENDDGTFEVTGVNDADKIKKDIFNNLSNPQCVSVNLFEGDPDKFVQELNANGKTIIRVTVPRANRKQKPVFIKNNPKTGTYMRGHEGDSHVSDEALQHMFSEKGTEPRDSLVLASFGMEDLDSATLKKYRQHFQIRSPEHRFNDLDDRNFLIRIGAWKRDRNTNEEGLTLAGLLMFGQDIAIKDYISHYHLDYIERENASRSSRYIDRVTLDGSWSGNLYDFYLIVYKKLTTDLKVPFKLESDQRSDFTPVHEAIREALVNTLAHADFSSSKPIIIVKRPDMFGFLNPGLMRIPPEQAMIGGDSDCRNAAIHDIFRMVGLSERMGSGVNQIFSNWSTQHWQKPKLYENTTERNGEIFEQTVLELKMVSLVPSETINRLETVFGDKFNALNELERLILITADVDRWVNHERIMQITDESSRTVTLAFQKLENADMLIANGSHKEKFCTLPGVKVSTVDEVFKNGTVNDEDLAAPSTSSEHSEFSSEFSRLTSQLSEITSGDNSSNVARDKFGRRLFQGLDNPFIDDLEELDGQYKKLLEDATSSIREKKRLPKDHFEMSILALCQDQYFSLKTLATLLGRNPDALRQNYLTRLIKEGTLTYAFPQQKNHENQGYITVIPDTQVQSD